MNTSEEKEDLMQPFGDLISFSSPSVVERYIFGIVTDDDLANAWVDEFGVKYSSDHLRLLKAPADLETYVIKEGCKIICVRAFEGCSCLTSIEIPGGVTEIGTGAFSGCSSLESITLPFVGDKPHTATDDYQYPFGYIFGTDSYTGGTVTKQHYYCDSTIRSTSATYYIPSSLKSVKITGSSHIPYGAFSGCTGLTSIEIPSSVTGIGAGAFSWCTGLTSIEIPSSVTGIDAGAFYGCTGLTSIEIPSSVTSIGSNAFYFCSGLTSIEIPSSVTSIGVSAFCGCTGLTSIEIPSGVTSIGESAFSGCTGLTSIVVASGNSVYDSRNNCNAIIETATNTLVAGCLNTVIPNSVTSIGRCAFCGCTGLTSIEIPSGVTSIGWHAFDGCTGLMSIVVASGNKVYDSRNNCNAIIESASDTLIAGCQNTIIPSSVTRIGRGAFSGCTSLTIIEIPDSVTSIGVSAVCGCTGLTGIVVASGNSVYDSRNNCNAIIETASNTLITGCQNTVIPSGVTCIGDNAFYSCTGLTRIEIPSSVTSIGWGAFFGCTKLARIEIPDSVTSIGGWAFDGCTSLAAIYIPKGSREKFEKLLSGYKDKLVER